MWRIWLDVWLYSIFSANSPHYTHCWKFISQHSYRLLSATTFCNAGIMADRGLNYLVKLANITSSNSDYHTPSIGRLQNFPFNTSSYSALPYHACLARYANAWLMTSMQSRHHLLVALPSRQIQIPALNKLFASDRHLPIFGG